MKLIFFTKYSRLGASSRLRSYQYFPYLEAKDIEVTAKPLFSSKYIKNLLEGNKSIIGILKAYLSRAFVLLQVAKYDHVVIEKELFPYFSAVAERLLSFLGVKYTLIYDDAIFHNYDLNSNKVIRFLLKNKIDKVMRYSKCVIAGNTYLAERAKSAGAKRIEIIPTVVDTNKYKPVNAVSSDSFVIGWIGSPSTFNYLKKIEPILEKICLKYQHVSLHVIGTKSKFNFKKNVKYIDWSEETEVSEIQKFDIGIMPLDNTPWELGKCAYKLIQYMGCGKPVIASAVGMNLEVVKNKENGLLVSTEEEWYNAFELMMQNNIDLQGMGNRGRALIEEDFSLQGTSKRFLEAITL